MLAVGMGRSYGDVCLNHGGTLLLTRPLNRFIAFDPVAGCMTCEAGVTLGEVLDVIVPHGWFLPVTPGTQHVTVGGAIANDVHGKNHHRAGSFGAHLQRLALRRSDGLTYHCTATTHGDLFRATVGGLGLTGLILSAEFTLLPITSPMIAMESIRFDTLAEYFTLTRESDAGHEYTVAWIDAASCGSKTGRGLFLRGNHAIASGGNTRPAPAARPWQIPCTMPRGLINRTTMRCFNHLYWHRQRARRHHCEVHYRHFFYPLDGLAAWNRLYGPRGFFQYQCVVTQPAVVEEILRWVVRSGGSSLAVLKVFGNHPAPGLLSFARPGITLALDFPNRGHRLFSLLQTLDELVLADNGALYPAKDARMPPRLFTASFPHWPQFVPFIDPAFSSEFWQRVTATDKGAVS